MRPRLAGLLLGLLVVPAVGWTDYHVTTANLDLQFSDSGMLNSAMACYQRCGSVSGEEGEPRRARLGGQGQALVDHGLPPGEWTMTPAPAGSERLLKFESATGARVNWLIPEQGYSLQLEIETTSEREGLRVQSGTEFRPQPSAGFGRWLERIRYVALAGRDADFESQRSDLDDASVKSWHTDGWVGFRKRYWALMLRPSHPTTVQPIADPGRLDAAIHAGPAIGAQRFDIYVGPVESGALAAADPALRDLLYGSLWFWLRWISFALSWILSTIHFAMAAILPLSVSWGVSILLLSLAVHVLMRPLTRVADRLQDQVHASESRLAPEISQIRKTQKGEAQAERILALYKREGVHPLYSLKSLLGVALVIPVFIGAFDMLAENIHLLAVPFLWIADLARPDAVASLPFALPFFGSSVNLLPFLMTGLSVLASSLHQSPAQHPALRRKQVRNMIFLATGFFVLFYTFPSGMVLYWTGNNLISAVKGGWRHVRQAHKAGENSDRE